MTSGLWVLLTCPSLLVCYITDEVERERPVRFGVPDPGAAGDLVLRTAVHNQGHGGLAQNGQEGWAGTGWNQGGRCVPWLFPEHVHSLFAHHGALRIHSRVRASPAESGPRDATGLLLLTGSQGRQNQSGLSCCCPWLLYSLAPGWSLLALCCSIYWTSSQALWIKITIII